MTLPTIAHVTAFSPEDQARIAESIAYMQADVGPISDEVGAALPLFVWDTELMRAFPAPVERVPLARVEHFLSAPVWRRAGDHPFSISPAQVAANPREHAHYYEHAMEVDLRYPIEVICYESGWRLADGYHRLLKAALLGQRHILAHLIPESAIPRILADIGTLAPPRGGRIRA